MDQLKAMLPAIKQHSFWGMCIGILVVSAVSWWMSTGALSKQKADRESQIKSSFGGVEQIKTQQPEHPNESTSKGMQALLERFSQQVAEGWKIQYDHQATVLVWPATFDQEFHDAVNNLRPIEAIPVTSAGQIEIKHDLPVDLRQQYRNYIEEDLPVLATTIGTKWLATSNGLGSDGGQGFSGPPGAGGAAGIPPGYAGDSSSSAPEVDTSIVLWPSASQQEIMKTHFAFTASPELPTTLEVLYAQEDLWVLQNIMDIIKSTNGDAETRHDAIIKELHFVRVGRSALGLAGAISAVGQNAQGGGAGMPPTAMPGGGGAPSAVGPPMGGGAGGGMPPVAGGGGASPMPGMPGTEGAAGAMTDLADGRYVDEQYQPLRAARLRGALASRDPNDALLAVAKRMPVRMRFKLDQRRLHRVLAECGNSKLPVEIRQVRINRPAAAGTGEGFSGMGGGGMPAGVGMPSGGGGGGGGGPPGVFGAGGEGMGGGFGGGARQGSAIADASIDPNLIDVEIYGVVYIYNPVNKSQLGLPEPPVTAMTPPPPAVPTTPTTSPATTTPPATTGAAIPAAAIPAVVGS